METFFRHLLAQSIKKTVVTHFHSIYFGLNMHSFSFRFSRRKKVDTKKIRIPIQNTKTKRNWEKVKI